MSKENLQEVIAILKQGISDMTGNDVEQYLVYKGRCPVCYYVLGNCECDDAQKLKRVIPAEMLNVENKVRVFDCLLHKLCF